MAEGDNVPQATSPVPGKITLGKKLYSTGTVPGPVPPEYMDTENLRAAQKQAKAAGLPPPDLGTKEDYIRGTGPTIAPPAAAPGSVEPMAPAKPETLNINMGGLPQWKSVLQSEDFRRKKGTEQNRIKERWLRTIADLNPQYAPDEIRQLRAKVYGTKAEPLGWLQDIAPAVATTMGAAGPEGYKQGAALLAAPFVGAAALMGKPDKNATTSMEKAYGKFIPGMAPPDLPKGTEGYNTTVREPGVLENTIDYWTSRGFSKGIVEVAKTMGQEGFKFLEQLQAPSSWVFGGLEGRVEKERQLARKEGRLKYLRGLPEGQRYKIYENIMFTDGTTNVDERIADDIRNVMVPQGFTVKDIDDAVIKGIKEKKYPEQSFIEGGWKPKGLPPYTPYEAIGYAVNNAIDVGSAWTAFWENLDYDTRKIKDADTLRKATKGKTYEEKYGFWKGLGANILLTSLADPMIWANSMNPAKPGWTGKLAASKLGQRVQNALAGKASLLETLQTTAEILKHGGKEAEELKPWLNLIYKEAKRDAQYADKDQQKIMDLLNELMQQGPTTEKAAAGATRLERAATDAGVPINQWWKNLPFEGVVPEKTAAEKVAGLDLSKIPFEGTAPAVGRTGQAAERVVEAAPVTAPSDVMGIADIGKIPTEEEAALRAAAERAGKVKEGFADITSKIEAEKAAEKAAAAAKEAEQNRKLVEEAGKIPFGYSAARVGQETIENLPKVINKLEPEALSTAPVAGAFGKVDNFKFHPVDEDGVTKIDNLYDDLRADEASKTHGPTSSTPDSPEEELRRAKELASAKAEEEASALLTHDIDTRKNMIKQLQKYESVAENPASMPVDKDKALEELKREWARLHPDEPDELTRLIKERQQNKRGEIVADPTGSDLSKPSRDNLTSMWKAPQDGTPEEIHLARMSQEKAADRELLDKAMKEFEAAGGKTTRIATRAEDEPRVIGSLQDRGSRYKVMADEGMEIHSDNEQTGHIASRLGGEWDDYKDSLKYAVETGRSAVKSVNVKGLKEAASQGWSGFNDKKSRLFEKVANDTLLGGKDKEQLANMFARIEQAAKAEMKSAGRKPNVIDSEVEKAYDYYDKIVKRNAGRKSPITAKKMSDGSIKITRVAHGRKETSFFTPAEHDDGEYLGSIFGMAQKFWDDRLAKKAGRSAKDALLEESEQLKKSLFSIDAQFKNFPKVGQAVKNMYSEMDLIKEKALLEMEAIAKVGKTGKYALGPGRTAHKLTDNDLARIPLLHENKALVDALPKEELERLKPILDRVDKYYEDFKNLYSERGADVDFKKHYQQATMTNSSRISDTIAALKDGTKSFVGKRDLADMGIYKVPENFNGYNKSMVGRILEEHLSLNGKILSEIDNFKYINIPYAMWFDTGFDKSAMLRSMKLANTQKRATFRIADLIESGAIKGEQVDLFDMMAAYANRAAKDVAMLDVKNAMISENVFKKFRNAAGEGMKRGVTKELREKGWSRVDARHFPFFADGMIHPAMKQWLYGFKYDRLNSTTFDKVLSSVKIWQFANPFFLPYYDIIQGGMARGFGLLNPVGWGKDLYAAAKMYKGKTPLYWELLHHGLDSKPMSLPFDQYTAQVNRLKGETGFEFLAKFGKDSAKSIGLKPIYEASWYAAWEMDKYIRLASANYLMRKGFSVAEAAKMSALLHSDYANVPMKTRRGLNRVLFTGTFKVTMFQVYKEMLKGMYKVASSPLTGKSTTKQEKLLAKAGLTGILGFIGGMDLLMTAKGYERDQMGRRYYKTYMTDEGPKEDVFVFSSPIMVGKYWETAKQLLTEDYRDDKAGQILNAFKYDVHPVYRISLDILRNKKADGKTIWEPFADSEPMKWAKNMKYATTQMLQIFKTIGMETQPEDQKKAFDMFKEEWGDLAAYAMSPTSFNYLRDPSVVRYTKELTRMQRSFNNQIKDMIEDEGYDEQKVERMSRELQRRADIILRKLEYAEKVNDHTTWERWKGAPNK